MIFSCFFLFRYVTIASACMATYRSGHIQPDTIAMVPVHGYVNQTNFSADSIRWLDYIASKEGIVIQHALNGTGEVRISGISVDGFCEDTRTVYQYQVILFPLIVHSFCFFFVCLYFYLNLLLFICRAVSSMAAANVMTGTSCTLLKE